MQTERYYLIKGLFEDDNLDRIVYSAFHENNSQTVTLERLREIALLNCDVEELGTIITKEDLAKRESSSSKRPISKTYFPIVNDTLHWDNHRVVV